MRVIATARHRGHVIRVLGDTVTEHFIGGQSETWEKFFVTIDGRDVTDQVLYLGTSDPAEMIANAKEFLGG